MRRPPLLRIISGPDTGHQLELSGREVTVGRGTRADLPLDDRLLSRQHARFYRAPDGWYIEDLHSTNGTWVDGQSIRTPIALKAGQHIRFGKTLLEVIAQDTPPTHDSGIEQTMISFALDPGSMESLTIATDGPAGKMRREQDKLGAIYEVQGLLCSHITEQELYPAVLATIAKVLPSDIACFLLYDPQDESIEAVAHLAALEDDQPDLGNYVSRSIVNHVREHQQAVLSSDALNEERMHRTYVSGMAMNSILCVPLLAQKELLGMIYLLSRQGSQVFQQDDLKLLTAIAQSAAMALENARLMARNLQQERLAAIGMTAAGLSHCIKNILTGLEGSISLLRMGIDGSNRETMDAAWSILSINHRRLSSLMLDLLSLSKELKLHFEPCNVADLVVEVAELTRNQVHQEKIVVELPDTVRQLPLIAEVDSRGIHRVLLNLCNNAVDAVRQRHGDSGQGRIRLHAWSEHDGDSLVLEVHDNGAGIPPEEMEKLFESFHSTKGDRGTGVGLAVSKRIVEGHQGRIDVHSKVNEYTVFTVYLPTSRGRSTTSTQFIKRSSVVRDRT